MLSLDDLDRIANDIEVAEKEKEKQSKENTKTERIALAVTSEFHSLYASLSDESKTRSWGRLKALLWIEKERETRYGRIKAALTHEVD